MATQRKKKIASSLPSEKTAPETHKVKRDRDLEVTREDGGGFFLAGTQPGKKVTIRPDGGIIIGNK